MTPEITALDQRLELGWARIDEANDPVLTFGWTDFWITLLHEYERACDAIRPSPRPQQERLI
jgi:hypothetical protein